MMYDFTVYMYILYTACTLYIRVHVHACTCMLYVYIVYVHVHVYTVYLNASLSSLD